MCQWVFCPITKPLDRSLPALRMTEGTSTDNDDRSNSTIMMTSLSSSMKAAAATTNMDDIDSRTRKRRLLPDNNDEDHGDRTGKISDMEASVSIMKAIMGAGSFALPWSFSMMGYVGGPFFLTLLLVMSVHSIKILVHCARGVSSPSAPPARPSQSLNTTSRNMTATNYDDLDPETERRGGRRRRRKSTNPTVEDSDTDQEEEMIPMINSSKNLPQKEKHQRQHQRQTHNHSYVDVAEHAFGTVGGRVALVASFASSIGVCGSYLIFIAENLKSLLFDAEQDSSSGPNRSSTTTMTTTEITWLVLPAAVALSSIREMKHFAFSSLLGDVSVILGMTVVLIYGILASTTSTTINDIDNHTGGNGQVTNGGDDHIRSFGEGCVAFGRSWGTMALAFGSIGYLFLIHFLILPIESSMTQPQNFDKVVDRTFSVCALLSGSFSVVGYMMFGDTTEQIVLLNVKGSVFVSAVQLLLCIDLLLTYPVVMRPSIEIAEQVLFSERQRLQSIWLERFWAKCSSSSSSPVSTTTYLYTRHIAVCTVLGVVAASAASFIPAFGILSGVVGGVSQTFLAFVFPPFMLAVQRRHRHHIDVVDTNINVRNGRNVMYGDNENNSHVESRNRTTLGSSGDHDEDCNDDDTDTDNHNNQQGWAVFDLADFFVQNLLWKEKSLVICGLLLIVWTIHSALFS